MTRIRTLGVAAALVLGAHALQAQQPSASAAAFGMAGNYTAAAQGYDAVAWNPAMLSLRSAPAFSMTLLSVGGVSGIDPVTPADFAPWGGQVTPAATKEAWLAKIGAGTERGRVDAGVTGIAMSIGRLGFQLSESGYGAANLNQDAAEALLFGNAGRTGSAKSFTFKGSNASAAAFTTGAVSVALPFPIGRPDQELSIGITGKYVVGSAVVRAQDNGSAVSPANLDVQFPIIYSPLSAGSGFPNNGSGAGLDVGIAWSSRSTTFGATVQNVVNTFQWSTAGLRTKLGTASFDGTTSASSFDDTLYSVAPASMRAALEAEKFKPAVAAGIAHRTSSLLLTADARVTSTDGIAIGPASHVGAGAEFTGIPWLPLRAGGAVITGGWQAAGGFGLRFGAYEFGAGAMLRNRDGGNELGLMLNAFSIR
jgi:hypothetical protein